MGRWGHRVFEGDTDCDLECDVQGIIHKKLEAKGVVITDDDLMELRYNFEKPDFRASEGSITTKELQGHLDALSDELFKHYKDKPDGFYGSYISIILGAVMMKAGATISDDNRAYLRHIAGGTRSSAGYRWPLADDGFRDPGKVQYLAALDHYENGKPRDFNGASCYKCGKINEDIAPKTLKKCGSCYAYYCDKDCQKANWKNHKAICGGPRGSSGGGFVMMNV